MFRSERCRIPRNTLAKPRKIILILFLCSVLQSVGIYSKLALPKVSVLRLLSLWLKMLTFCHLEMDFALGSFVNDILKKVFDDGHLLASFRGSVLRLIPPPPSSFEWLLCVDCCNASKIGNLNDGCRNTFSHFCFDFFYFTCDISLITFFCCLKLWCLKWVLSVVIWSCDLFLEQ